MYVRDYFGNKERWSAGFTKTVSRNAYRVHFGDSHRLAHADQLKKMLASKASPEEEVRRKRQTNIPRTGGRRGVR